MALTPLSAGHKKRLNTKDPVFRDMGFGSILDNIINESNSTQANTTNLQENIMHSALSKSFEKMHNGSATSIVCYGDSVTYGYQYSDGTQVANPYPAVLQTLLRANYNNNNITVYNEGHTGHQSDEALVNVQNYVVSKSPDLAIVMFGINDCRGSSQGSAILPDTFRSNMSKVIETLLTNNIEVLLLSPTPILDTTNNNKKHLLVYVGIVKELAQQYKVAFIDTHREITKRFLGKNEVPFLLFPDGVHFADTKYALIAETILGSLLDYHTKVKYISGVQEMHIPAAYSPYIDTDSTYIYTNDGQYFRKNYVLKSDVSVGTYLRFEFYIDTPGMSLLLNGPKNNLGGQIVVTDNGVTLKTLDFYSPEWHVIDSEDVLIENLSIGLHQIEFLVSSMAMGQSVGAYSNAYFTEFIIKPSKSVVSDVNYNITGGTLPTTEVFKKISNGLLRHTNTVTQGAGNILFSKDSAELKTDKTLVIEAEGTFYSLGAGITWFGNAARGDTAGANASGVNSGYMVFFYGASSVRLYKFGQNNIYGSPLADSNTAVNYGISHKLRITHTKAGVITVFLDGTQIIQVTDTAARSGWFGVYSYNAGTMELTRYEYAYI